MTQARKRKYYQEARMLMGEAGIIKFSNIDPSLAYLRSISKKIASDLCSKMAKEKVVYLVEIALKVWLLCSIDWNTRSKNTWWHGIFVEELPSQWSNNVLPMGDWCESGDTRVRGLGLLQSVLDCDSSPSGGGLSGYWITKYLYHSHIFLCPDIGDGHWYGGPEELVQHFPMRPDNQRRRTAYLPGDMLQVRESP